MGRLGIFSYSHSQPQASNVAMDAAAAPSCSTAAAGAPPTAADPSRARRSAARRAQPAPQAGPQPQPHPPTPAVAVDAGRDAGVAARALPPAVVAMAAPNARERRSAVRSGRRHAARRQRLFRCQTLALLFLLKLRRRARLRRDLQDLEELSDMPPRLLRGPARSAGRAARLAAAARGRRATAVMPSIAPLAVTAPPPENAD